MPTPYTQPFPTEADAIAAIEEQIQEIEALAVSADGLDITLRTTSTDPVVQQAFADSTVQLRNVARQAVQAGIAAVARNLQDLGVQIAPAGPSATASTETAPTFADKAAVQAAVRSLVACCEDAKAELLQDPPPIEDGRSTSPRVRQARERGAQAVEAARAGVAREILSIAGDELVRIGNGLPAAA